MGCTPQQKETLKKQEADTRADMDRASKELMAAEKALRKATAAKWKAVAQGAVCVGLSENPPVAAACWVKTGSDAWDAYQAYNDAVDQQRAAQDHMNDAAPLWFKARNALKHCESQQH